jgi:serine protease AprX
MQKKRVIFLLVSFLILISGCEIAGMTGRFIGVLDEDTVLVEDIIEEKLQTEEEVSVIIILKEPVEQKKFFAAAKQRLEEKRGMIKEQQEKVLSKLNLEAKKEFSILSVEQDLKLKHKYSTVNAFSGKLTKQGLEKLKNDPNVKSIHINKKYSMTLDGSIPQINADDVWQIQLNSTNITGAGETVCIVDTGADYNHSALGGGWGNKVISGYRSLNNGADQQECAQNPDACFDDEGHGTHVAGIVASSNDTYTGVAPDAKLVAVKVLDSSGNGWASDIIAGIDWCINNASRFNISVISMSLGDCSNHSTYCNNDPIAPSINTAVGQNITVMVAAGNGPGGSCTGIINTAGPAGPACVENATAVGAVTSGDSISYQRGALFEILAPGISICSSRLPGDNDGSACGGGTYVSKSGTSMSTPHAAGAAALLQQFNKLQNGTALTAAQIKDVLNDTGVLVDDSASSGYNFSRIDIYAAVQSLDEIPPNNVTFVNPTPANGTSTFNISIIINITIKDYLNNISSCLLEWNNTNESITKVGYGTSVSCYINKSITGYGLFYYKVYTNDSRNNFNTSELRQIFINNTAPSITSFYPNITNINIAESNNQTFNITYSDINNDSITVTWYQNGTIVSNSDNYTFLGNFSTEGSYNITVIINDSSLTDSQSWNLTVNNTDTAPKAVNVTLISTDSLNRTNGALQAAWDFSDPDGSNQTDNETKWYNNSVEVSSLANLTSVTSGNTTRDQIWIFSVRVYDGADWSNWTNSSSLIIQDTAPEMSTISNETINATAIVSITVSATDIDGDTLNYSINDSNFTQTNNVFTWQTTVNDFGTYVVNIIVSDNSLNASQLVYITVCLDSDGDGYNVTSGCGTVDFNDTDANKYPGASCSRSCYSGSTYSASGSCTGGTYTCDDDSSGGGSGGGSSVSSGGRTFIVDFARGAYTKPLSQRDRIRFDFKAEQHHATVTNISSEYVKITIESDPITVIIYESETVKVDIDNDNIYDLLITLNDIVNTNADLIFESIAEPVVEEEIITPEAVPTTLVEEEIPEPEVVEEPVVEEPAPAYFTTNNETLEDTEAVPEYSIFKEGIIYILAAVIGFLITIFIIFIKNKKRGLKVHETKIHKIRKNLRH